MSELNEFLILLQAKLDEAKSKRNIDADIDTLQNQIKKIRLQAEIDTKSIGTGQETGKRIGNSINKGLALSLRDVKHTISETIKSFSKLSSFKLSEMFNLNRDDIDSYVTRQLMYITKEIESLSTQILKSNSDESWNGIINKIDSLHKVLNQFGKIRDTSSFKESIELLNWFNGKRIFVGDKSEVLQNTGMTIKGLNDQFRNLVSFTTSAKGSIKLDTIWDELNKISPGLEKFTAFGDQIMTLVDHFQTAKEALKGSGGLIPVSDTGEASKVLVDYIVNLENATKKLSALREEQAEIEQMIVKGSTVSADKVIQNEQRKQQAYRETANAQKQIARDESLIKSDANILTFGNSNNAAREASQYFKELLKDENALIAVSERFNKANELNSFTVNIKRASGEVETLRYALENIGTVSDPFYVFKNVGAVLNESGAVKQMQQMEKIITDYQTKLDTFKTKYSKTNIDFSGFDETFNNFRNGIGTVNDLKLAFNQLENSAKMGMNSLKSQKASLDPIQQAINNMRDMPTMLKNLETNMAGIQDKTVIAGVSISDLSARYMKLKAGMDAAGGKVPLDNTWVKEYQKLMSDVVSATRQATAEQAKMGKQSKSLFASLKSGMSFLSYYTSLRYIFMQAVRGIKEVVSNVNELDSALTNIAYTMDVSNKQLKQIGESSLQAAKDLHTSVSKVLDAVKTYANAQETAESIIEKSKPTIMMSNVTGMDINQTVDILQGVMEQFDLAEDQLMHISDVMQTVSMSMPYDFANGVKELSEGIKASGSTAKDAGYDLENYTALLGTLIAKTRQSGGELGRSLRTMFVRTTKASTTALANGEVTEDDLSNAEKALRRVGIEVRSDINTFKSFDEIMGELYKKVDSLSDVDLSNIAYEVASTRQTNVFKMMIKAYGDYQEMAEQAYNAENVTLKNQEKYAESLTGKMGEMSAIWEKIGDDAVSSKFLKGLADAGIAVSSLIEKAGLLKTAMGIGLAGIFGKGRSNDFALWGSDASWQAN